MKIKMNDLLLFRNFYNKIKDKNLPIKTSYKFMKIFNKVDEELTFYQEEITKISEEYGERDKKGNLVSTENGQGIKIQEDKITECQNKINELLDLEIEIQDFSFSIQELDKLELTIEDLQLIQDFIAE